MLTAIQKLFNLLFSEDNKEAIRRQFAGILNPIYRRIRYTDEIKRARNIIKSIEYGYTKNETDRESLKNDFRGLVHILSDKVDKECLRSKIENTDIEFRDQKMKACYEYTVKYGVRVFCGQDLQNKTYDDSIVGYDEENELFFGLYRGKKLYLPYGSNVSSVLSTINVLELEQGLLSPHRYLSDAFSVEAGDVVMDIGCADGNFALETAEKAGEIYLFEILDKWQKPLKCSFDIYSKKTHIIRKLVSDVTDDENNEISIDDFCERNKIDHIDILKADIEGFEEKMLDGAKKMLDAGRIKKIAICTYHSTKAEENISKMLPNYNLEVNPGYMLYAEEGQWEKLEPPYFVKGVMHATLKTSK